VLQENAVRVRFGPFRCVSAISTTGQPAAIGFLGSCLEPVVSLLIAEGNMESYNHSRVKTKGFSWP